MDYSAPHVYNLVAKVVRENYPTMDGVFMPGQQADRFAKARLIEAMALDFAKSFQKNDPNFNPIRWLEKCSPDNESYPITELWVPFINADTERN